MSEVEENGSPPNKRPKLENEGSSVESSAATSNNSADTPNDSADTPNDSADTPNDSADTPNDQVDFTRDDVEIDNKFTIYDKYTNYVTPDEVEKLKEFKILDEVNSNDEDSNNEDSDSSEGKEVELPDDEIEKMLDENLPEELKAAPKPKEKPYVTRTKIILEEKGINQFEVLPVDWMMIRHYSGMPIYVHRPTRVCTLAKPYFLGKGNIRRHDIPISAIPCLAYRRALEEEEKQQEIDRRVEEQIKNNTWSQPQQNNTDANQSNDNIINNDDSKTDEVTSEIKSDSNTITDAVTSPYTQTNTRKRQCPFKDLYTTPESINEPGPSGVTAINPFGEPNDAISMINIESIKTEAEGNDAQETAKATFDDQDAVKSTDGNEGMNEEANGVANEGKEDADEGKQSADEGKEDANERKEGANEDDDSFSRRHVVLPDGLVVPAPRVESVDSSWKTQHLSADQINDYCKQLFKFKTVNFMHFNRWADRRKYTKARKALQYPKLPQGTKLITIPASATGQENGGKVPKRDWVMNMNGSSYLSEFHEYVCRALHKQPVYEYKQLENASTPYQATVLIGGMAYGVGRGSSKRLAKYAAARASIQTLIPGMRDVLGPDPEACLADPDFSFFDYVDIEDPRIPDFCAATCEPSPHAILLTCLLRNFGIGEWHVKVQTKKLEYQKMELTMRVGRHKATVVCKNKKSAKQRAAQSILKALHPHVTSWGSLLRLYGSRSVKSCKEKKLEEQQITLLQDKARHNEPNYAVLEKLRSEMRKLQERDRAVVPLGTLMLADTLPEHSASNLNNVDL